MAVRVAAVWCYVATCGPASLTWMMCGQLVRVALSAQTSGSGQEHRRVLRSVWRMAFIASASAESSYRIVLVDERSRFIRMANHALALERSLSCNRALGWVSGVTVATDKLSLRYRVVEVQSELRNLRLVALSAQRHFVRLKEHLPGRLLGYTNLSSRVDRIASLDSLTWKVQIGIWMQLVAGNTR